MYLVQGIYKVKFLKKIYIYSKNNCFVEYLEDWNFLPKEMRKELKCNHVCVQNDFHYSATLLLSQLTDKNSFEANNPNSVTERMNLEDGSDQSELMQAPAAAELKFGNFPNKENTVPTVVTDVGEMPPNMTNTNAMSTTKLIVTLATENSLVSENVNEPMDTHDSVNQNNLVLSTEDLLTKSTVNTNDRASTNPLETPTSITVYNNKPSNAADSGDTRTFQLLSFDDKQKMLQPILSLEKVEKVDESTLNEFLTALMAVKEEFRNQNLECDVATEHWILLIMLKSLDAESLRWWKLLMTTARPAIEVLTDFLVTRVEGLKAAAKPFRIPKRPQSPEPSTSTGKKNRSRSTSRSRPTGTIPKNGRNKAPVRSRSPSTSHAIQPNCRYCKTGGHVVANCPVYKSHTPENREANLFRKRLCIVCLLPHGPGQCKKANQPCPVCGKPHHAFLIHRP